MTVQELIHALRQAANHDAEVDIIDRNGDEISFGGNYSIDEDADGETVHIVVADSPKL